MDGLSAACWGAGSAGQLGNGKTADSDVPQAVLLSSPTAIEASGDYTCAILAGGTAACWGEGRTGQLGNADLLQHSTPMAVHLPGHTVRARPGRLSGLNVFHSNSSFCGAFVWARRALNG